MNDQNALVALAVAGLGGLAVGIEREWSARQERDHSRFGGVRTFLLLGLLGGCASLLAAETGWAAGAAAITGGVLIVALAYFVSASHGTIDATTEVAGVLVLAAGALAGAGRLTIASSVFAATAFVLVEKSRMHAAVERLRSEEIAAAARFAVLALVILPLLPTSPLAWLAGIEPRWLWGMVLVFAGLSFAGYLALRLVGPHRGWGVAGLFGGLVSSTAVTLSFARESRARPEAGVALAGGAIAASTVMPLRVAALSAVLNVAVARAVVPVVALPIVLGVLVAGVAWRGPAPSGAEGDSYLPTNPLRLGAAIQMTALFAAVAVALDFVRARFGSGGLFSGALLLGLADLDALTYSMSRLAASGTAAGTAAQVLAVGMAANSLFKAGLALVVGRGRFRLLVGAGMGIFVLLFLGAFAALGG
jgi:uncharacterized membrane protein (DUF4010 family)